MKYSGNGDWLRVSRGAFIVMKGRMNPHGIYIMDGYMVGGRVIVSQSLDQYDDENKLWHVSEKGLFGGDATRKVKPGEACFQEIQLKVKFISAQHLRKEIRECVYSDLWGPSHVKSHGGCQYFVTFIVDYSRKTWVYFLKTNGQDEVFRRSKEWKKMAEKQIGNHFRSLIT